ncbi:MAG: hydrogenase small subunit [Thermincolia bacterium]
MKLGDITMLSRRGFVKLVLSSTAALSVADLVVPRLAEAFQGKQRPPVIWLECMTCTGNFLSFLNSAHPTVKQLLFETVDFHFSNTMMAAEGVQAVSVLDEVAANHQGEYILIVEGTVPLRDNGRYCIIGHRADGREITALEAVQNLGSKAKYVMAVGSCATFGGPFAARPNPSKSVPVSKVLSGVQVINVSGCPAHPDWTMGTLAHLLLYGIPDLDGYNRPTLFYGDLIHDNCPRRQHFENSIFAKHPGEEGCLYKIGCKGPVTHSDCPTRQWSGEHHSWPVEANTPCIGCTAPEFIDGMTPFFHHLPNVQLPGVTANSNQFGLAVGALTLAGIGAHLTGKIITGRQHKKWVNNTISNEPENPAVYAVEEEPEAVTIAKLDQLLEGQKNLNQAVARLAAETASKEGEELLTKKPDRPEKRRWFFGTFAGLLQAARKRLPLRRK